MSGGLRTAVRRRAKSRLRERGAVAVEFALVLPLVIMLLIGTITTGLSYSHALAVTNAVREGARFGATADATSGSWAADVATRVRQTQFDDPSTETAVCVQLVQNNAAIKSACDAGVSAAAILSFTIPTVPPGVCVVRVVAARQFTISAPPLLPGVERTMLRGSVARYERSDKFPTCK